MWRQRWWHGGASRRARESGGGVDAAIVIAIGSAVDPSGMPIEGDVDPRPVQPQASPNRPGRPIDITLRSTPAGALVAVDGAVLGYTPAYWMGTADGREHEFVFTLRGYAIARYRFVPLTSGVIHGRLERITEEVDAGSRRRPKSCRTRSRARHRRHRRHRRRHPRPTQVPRIRRCDSVRSPN